MVAARKKKLTKAEREKREKAIIADLKAGKLSYRAIAKKHGVSLPTVNAKARKAGIRRRKAAKVATRKVAARTRKVAAKAARKKVARRKVTRKTATRAAKKVAKKAVRRAAAARTARSMEKFQEQFRALLLNYYPNMSLRTFEKISKMIAKAIK